MYAEIKRVAFKRLRAVTQFTSPETLITLGFCFQNLALTPKGSKNYFIVVPTFNTQSKMVENALIFNVHND